jgi:hypothetical protein
MKKSHKKILELLRIGYLLKENPMTLRTHGIYFGSILMGTVRNTTLEEMEEIGLLRVRDVKCYTMVDPSLGE